MSYNVDNSLALDGEVQESSCECFAGHSTGAHCKHIIATLFGITDHSENKPINTAETCTEKLQTWHQPSKRHSGSPLKAKDMAKKKF